MCRNEAIKVRKMLVNASISGFYQTISVNAGICRHLLVKVRNEKKMKATSSKRAQKPALGQNVRVKIPDIDRAKTDPRSIIAVITDVKDEEFYELGTKLGKLKALYTRNQFTLCKENF
jgi:hypothetical protein